MDSERTIRDDALFDAQAAQIEPNAVQRDEIFEGVEWELARNPRIGERVGHSDVWAVPTRSFVNRQEEVVYLTIYYRFDDDYVTLIAVTQTVIDP